MADDYPIHRWTRREVLGLFGTAAGVALPSLSFAAAPTFPRGAVIRTVLKDYAPDELAGGATLFHEHMSFAADFLRRFDQYAAEMNAANGVPPAAPAPTDVSFMQDLDLMSQELIAARRDGIGCIVDGGHPDMGRNITSLRQLSMKSGMPIVAGAGYYTQPFYPKEIGAMSEEQIVRALVKQVETEPVGAFGEIGSWDYMTAVERKVFRAIGRAHLETDLPISHGPTRSGATTGRVMPRR